MAKVKVILSCRGFDRGQLSWGGGVAQGRNAPIPQKIFEICIIKIFENVFKEHTFNKFAGSQSAVLREDQKSSFQRFGTAI